MKYKLSLVVMFASVFIGVFARMVQLFKFTDPSSGLFLANKNAIGWYSFLLTFLLIFACIIALSTTKRSPKRSPKFNNTIIMSFLLLFLTSSALIIENYQSFLYKLPSVNGNAITFVFANLLSNGTLKIIAVTFILNLAFAIFTLVAFLSYLLKFKFPNYLYCVPMFYWLIYLVINYINISKMPLIAENLWLIIATATATLFSLELAELTNTIKTKYQNKKILFSGVLSSTFCLGFSIPQLIYSIANPNAIVHNNLIFVVQYLAFGIFSLVYILSYFSKDNLPVQKFKDARFVLPY